jgi:hypothetical protein
MLPILGGFLILCVLAIFQVLSAPIEKPDLSFINANTLSSLFISDEKVAKIHAKFLRGESLEVDLDLLRLSSCFTISTKELNDGMRKIEIFLRFHQSYEEELQQIFDELETFALEDIIIFRRALFQHFIRMSTVISNSNRSIIITILQRLNYRYYTSIKESSEFKTSVTMPELENYLTFDRTSLPYKQIAIPTAQLTQPYYYPVIISRLKPVGKLKKTELSIWLEGIIFQCKDALSQYPKKVSWHILSWSHRQEFALPTIRNGNSCTILENQYKLSVFGPPPQVPVNVDELDVKKSFYNHFMIALLNLKIHEWRAENMQFAEHLHSIILFQLKQFFDQLKSISDSLFPNNSQDSKFTNLLIDTAYQKIDALKKISITPPPRKTIKVLPDYTHMFKSERFSQELLLFLDTWMFNSLVLYQENFTNIKQDLEQYRNCAIPTDFDVYAGFLQNYFSLKPEEEKLISGHLKLWYWFLIYFKGPCNDPQKCLLVGQDVYARVETYSCLIEVLPIHQAVECHGILTDEMVLLGKDPIKNNSLTHLVYLMLLSRPGIINLE